MSGNKKNIKEVLDQQEVKISDLILLFSQKRRVFYITLLVIVFLGIVKYWTTPKEYESVAIMLSEVEEDGGKMGQLGGLAGLAGINLSSMSGTNMNNSFSPELYPKLLESKSFLLGLIKEEFYFETKGKKMSIEEYMLEERPDDVISKSLKFIVGFPNLILSLFEEKIEVPQVNTESTSQELDLAYIHISPDQSYVIEEVKKLIKIDTKGRMITLSVKMPEPVIAAEFNVLVFKKILDFVRNYKIEKKKNNLFFIEASALEAEDNFKKAQINLAAFRDANQGIISQRVRTREEQLNAEFNLAFQLYSSLKQELENSKIELKKETPIFTVFEEAVVPNAPANSSPFKVILISFFLGAILGFFLIFLLLGRDYIRAYSQSFSIS